MVTIEQVREAHIRTMKAWDDVCRVETQCFNPHRKRIFKEYLDAVRAECDINEKYADETGIVPRLRLPFEYYYLYYKQGTFNRQRWEKICEHYRLTGEQDLSIGRYEVYG